MKLNTFAVIVAAGLLAAGTTFAGNGQGPRGKGYGGPPQSAEERAARQADCLKKNDGICPQGGPGANCQGKGQGQGNQWRKGARDGNRPACRHRCVPGQPRCGAEIIPPTEQQFRRLDWAVWAVPIVSP